MRFHHSQPIIVLCSCDSLLLLEVGNDVGSVLGVGDTGESHGITGSVVSGRLEVLVEVLIAPLALTSELATINCKESRSAFGSSVSCEYGRWGACVSVHILEAITNHQHMHTVFCPIAVSNYNTYE